jgi:putative aldouronate transport system substrate-binding protein
MEGRAKQRLDDTANIWFDKVNNFEYYPSVVYSLEETDTINNNISDIKDYVSETSANWIINGGVEKEWNNYINQLNSMGVNDVVAAWQSAYDRYQKETK